NTCKIDLCHVVSIRACTDPLYGHRLVGYFSCFLVVRDLHSFPTRRSSDLLNLTTKEVLCSWMTIIAIATTDLKILMFQVKINKEDRKSTRLNSSHVSNSYAVFCLKKKNNTDALDRHELGNQLSQRRIT